MTATETTTSNPRVLAADPMVELREAKDGEEERCGGIGEDESTAMRSAMKNYPLALLFAEKSGAYLANVTVDIRSKQVSSQFTAEGPVCLLKLPAGSYSVSLWHPQAPDM